MERTSSKHGPRADEQIKSEGPLGQGDGRAEEFRQTEAGPLPESRPEDRDHGTPEGMTVEDVEHRRDLARFLDQTVFPANRTMLLESARDNAATDRIIADINRLPDGREFQNVQDIWRELGGSEEKRF